MTEADIVAKYLPGRSLEEAKQIAPGDSRRKRKRCTYEENAHPTSPRCSASA